MLLMRRWLAIITSILLAYTANALPQTSNAIAGLESTTQAVNTNISASNSKPLGPTERSKLRTEALIAPVITAYVFDAAHLWLSNIAEAWSRAPEYVIHRTSIPDIDTKSYTVILIDDSSLGHYTLRDFMLLVRSILRIYIVGPVAQAVFTVSPYKVVYQAPGSKVSENVGILSFQNFPRLTSSDGVSRLDSKNQTSVLVQTKSMANSTEVLTVPDPEHWPTVIVVLHKRGDTRLYHKMVVSCIESILSDEVWSRWPSDPVPPVGSQYSATRGADSSRTTVQIEVLKNEEPGITITHHYIDAALRAILVNPVLHERPVDAYLKAYIHWKGKRAATAFLDLILYQEEAGSMSATSFPAGNATSENVEVFS